MLPFFGTLSVLFTLFTVVGLYWLMRRVGRKFGGWAWLSCAEAAAKCRHGNDTMSIGGMEVHRALFQHVARHTASMAFVVYLVWRCFSPVLHIDVSGFLLGQVVVLGVGHYWVDHKVILKPQDPWVLLKETRYDTTEGGQTRRKTVSEWVKRPATKPQQLSWVFALAAFVTATFS